MHPQQGCVRFIDWYCPAKGHADPSEGTIPVFTFQVERRVPNFCLENCLTLNQSGIWSFYNFSDHQSEMNLKAIWSQSEIWKVNLELNSREKSILHYLKLNPREKLIRQNLKLNSRGVFIVADCLSVFIRAASSSADCSLASICLYLSNLISSSLAFCSKLTLLSSSKTRLFSSIMALSTYAHFLPLPPPSLLFPP